MRRFPGLLAFALLLASCTERGPDNEFETWVISESLRIGTMEEGPASFGWIRSVDADGQGRVWVFDHQSQQIRVFGPDGAHLMNVGRKGAGPGEFHLAEGIAFGKDGRLWARDAGNSRLSVFSADGTFEDSRATTFCWSQGHWDPVMTQAERILDYDCWVGEGRTRGHHVLGYRTDLSGVDTIADIPSCGDEQLAESATWITRSGTRTRYIAIPWAPRNFWAVGGDGETWCVPNSSKFEILRFAAGTMDTTRITEVVADVPVTQAQRDSVIRDLEADGATGNDYSRLPTRKPAIDRITVDDEGHLWVWSTDADGVREFRVYSRTGGRIAQARVPGLQLSTYGPFTVRGNSIYTASVDHEEIPIVLRLSIAKPGS